MLQVSEWLGHADPSFILSTYIHLLDDGIGGADFFDECLGDYRGTIEGLGRKSDGANEATS
jgi:hypothetical protein